MRARQVRAAATIPLIVSALAGCGGSEAAPKPIPGKTLRGETETGMKLKVDTFVDPSTDPMLKKLEDYRAVEHYPAADFHRVTADNTQGQVPDSGRVLTFARDSDAIIGGAGIQARFSCEALNFEWLPHDDSQKAIYTQMMTALCKDGPPKQDGIARGARKVYYLVTDRGFSERGIRTLRLFGPRNTELK